jgi:DNA (cytosine-5)-methyltransferase 1
MIKQQIKPTLPIHGVMHRFSYRWTLKDANFTKDKGKVFSCFACGGGSTMGYKLAGFDVIGCNEIDPKMIEAYKANHNPKYAFLEPIQTFKMREDLPKELYELDILDGSPPCSSFSMTGNREKDWGKDKVFREGQAKQVLDNLFFDFIDLAKKLQPKVVVAENVEGLLLGNAIQYVREIYREFDLAGYYCQHWLLDGSKMGVPQRRKRVFFVAFRKDLSEPFLEQVDMFTISPTLKLDFKEPEITYKEVRESEVRESEVRESEVRESEVRESFASLWRLCKPGDSFSTVHPKGHYFGETKMHPDKVACTIIANQNGSYLWDYEYLRTLTELEMCRIGTYPTDYNWVTNKPKYLIGMSVPPVMTANIATEIYSQWLSKLARS